MALEPGWFDELSRSFEAWCSSRGLDSDEYLSFVAYVEYVNGGEDVDGDEVWLSMN
jgi:hypothetical protein